MKIFTVFCLTLILSGCVTPSAILVNDKGTEVTCQAAGFGIISGTMANNRYEACVSEAQMRGFQFKDKNNATNSK
ncbi:MAG TPA: hypothetical protein EYH06_08340 [Chromatiales bacterium]|nr:hypothetical protein [Thiotrichales bacterium]HIP68584.1 hypothetical protein [Chromatiales bacterium]